MKWKVEYSDQAKTDLHDIYEYMTNFDFIKKERKFYINNARKRI